MTDLQTALSGSIQSDTEMLVVTLIDFLLSKNLEPAHPAVAMACMSIAATSVGDGIQKGFYQNDRETVLEGYRQISNEAFSLKAQDDIIAAGELAGEMIN